MSVQAYNYEALTIEKPTKRPKPLTKKKKEISGEDIIILATLEKLKKDLDAIYSSLDSVTDPVLIDSYIFEMNAINMRYKFYLRQCKDKGIVGKIF
ncbi:MAG: YaaL family protein [Defluviitaleaceae bacterium]|nr:YaaL family protein [Defluviitaleaceae bacterium]